MASNKPPDEPVDLSLWGISDTEMLAIVDDLADENGWTATLDVRLQVGENIERVGARSGAGSRLAWMRRYGWLEKDPDSRPSQMRWRLTAMGHAILDGGELTKAMQNALDKLNPAQRVQLTRAVARDGASSPDEVRQALRREWRRSLDPRRRRY